MGLSSGALQNVLHLKYVGMIPNPARKCLRKHLGEKNNVLPLQGSDLQIQKQI